MKSVSLFVLSVVASLCLAQDTAADENEALTLEQAYGTITPVSTLRSWAERKAEEDRDSDYWESRRQCDYPFEVVIVQDASMNSTVTAVSNQLDSIYSFVHGLHADSKIGLTSFVDKPRFPYGDPTTAYCHRLEAPLSSDASAVRGALKNLESQGSNLAGDIWSSQFDALVNTAGSENVKWTKPSGTPARLIVLITPSPPHFAQDGLNVYRLPSWTDASKEQCLSQYYPSPHQVREILEDSETYLMVAVMPRLSQPLAYQNYQWFTSFLGFPGEFVTLIGDRSSALTEAITSTINQIRTAECSTSEATTTTEPITTTTEATTTELTTTEATTTEPTTVATTAATTTTEPTTTTTGTTATTTEATTAGTTATTTTEATTTTGASTTSTTTTGTTRAPESTTRATTEATTTTAEATTSSASSTATTEATTTTTTKATTEDTTTTNTTGTTQGTTATTEASTTMAPTTTSVAATGSTTVSTSVEVSGTEGEICDEDTCGCPEVLIKLKEKPKRLELSVINDI